MFFIFLKCDSSLKIHKNVMQAKKLKTILLGKFDPINYNKLLSNFSFNSITTKQTGVKCPVYNIIEKKTNSTNKLWPNKSDSNKTNNPNESKYPNDKQLSFAYKLNKWIDDNKITLFLLLLIIVFAIIIFFLLKTLDKNMYCKYKS